MAKNKKNKEFLIIGLGTFGKNLIRTLHNSNIELMVIDNDAEKLEEIQDMATTAICADASKEEVLSQLDIKAFDGAVITIGRNMEASVKIIMHLSEMGMPFIMAKATSDFEGRIYTRVGADKVIFPEAEVGIRLGREIAMGNYFDSIDLTDKYSITEIPVHSKWVGKTLVDINMRKIHGLSVVGIKRAGEFIVNPGPDFALDEDDELVILGNNNDIMRVRELE